MASSAPPRGNHPGEDAGRVGYLGRGPLYSSDTCLVCGNPREDGLKPPAAPGLQQLRRFLCVECLPK